MNDKKQKRKNHFLCVELKRCIGSVRFLMVTLGIAATCIAGCLDTLVQALRYPDFPYFSSLVELERMLTFDRFKCVMTAILAALYSGSYSEDQNHHYLRGLLTRISLERYTFIRLLVLLIGCVAASVLGFLLMSICLLPWMGICNNTGNMVAMKFLPLASGNTCIVYLILLGINFGMAAAISAVIGMWLTVYRCEAFVAVGGAVLAFYFLYFISNCLPAAISYETIGSRMNEPRFQSCTLVLLYHLIYLGTLFALAGILFFVTLRRRWKRGTLV